MKRYGIVSLKRAHCVVKRKRYTSVSKRRAVKTVRVKTDVKRREIVSVAWEVFRAKGFDGASMADVADRLGGSKATVYRYFRSKELLFAAALEEALRDQSDDAYEKVSRYGDLRDRLLAFAETYVRFRLTPEMIGVHRLMIAAAEQSELPAALRAEFIDPNWRRFVAVIEREMAAGRLRKADPYLASIHFRGLVEADVLERRLNGERLVTQAQVKTAIVEGVAAFLRAYAP
jgi:AcrR family transcriptional regulator